MKAKLTRRKMLHDSATVALGSTILLRSPLSVFSGQPDKTRVVLVRDANLLDSSGRINQQVLTKMLDDALVKLTGTRDGAAAWGSIIKPADVVGIKTNSWPSFPTPPELESIIKSKVLAAGVKETDVSVKDRGVSSDPVFMRSTALINVRPMRAHAWAGVGTLIKNYIIFLPQPSEIHGDSCADLATVWSRPEIKGKTKLNILVMINPLFHIVGSNYYNKEYTWPYQGLIAGFDPVAVDSTGLRIIQAKRRDYFKEERPLNPPAKHIEIADTRHHLGTSDPAKIELVKLGWTDSVLI
jgi:hypothetical protein